MAVHTTTIPDCPVCGKEMNIVSKGHDFTEERPWGTKFEAWYHCSCGFETEHVMASSRYDAQEKAKAKAKSYIINNIKKDNLTFSEALIMLRGGHRMARKGWNGKGMCIYYTDSSEVAFANLKDAVQDALIATEKVPVDVKNPVFKINPHVDMICANGTITCGWVASQTDMLANDWYSLE